MYRLRVPARDEVHAHAISDALIGALYPETRAAGLVETEKGWLAEAFYLEAPDEDALADYLARVLDGQGDDLALIVESIADRDWVKESLAAMPPVYAGRFAVFGGHDRARIPANAIGVEIEASQAFGTGHHGTTLGCLLALDGLLKRRRYRQPLDIGTGTGVLAIALAKALRVPVIATDNDPVAVRIARENTSANGAGGQVRAIVADGVRHVNLRRQAPYDLIVANILAGPLIRLAPEVARISRPGTSVVLSGLRNRQRRAVEAAWRNVGFCLDRRLVIDGWATLLLVARGRVSSRRRNSSAHTPRGSGPTRSAGPR